MFVLIVITYYRTRTAMHSLHWTTTFLIQYRHLHHPCSHIYPRRSERTRQNLEHCCRRSAAGALFRRRPYLPTRLLLRNRENLEHRWRRSEALLRRSVSQSGTRTSHHPLLPHRVHLATRSMRKTLLPTSPRADRADR